MPEKQKPQRYVLDAGALVGVERRNPKVTALLKGAPGRQIEFFVPSGVLAQVWRDGARKAALSKALSNPTMVEVPLDHAVAKRIGALLRTSGSIDVIDAHVAVLAGQLQAPVVTSDPGDIAKLNPDPRLVRV